jgi:hypothetical protein
VTAPRTVPPDTTTAAEEPRREGDPNGLAAQTAGLAPLYAAAVTTLTWGFRTGGALLVAGILLALATREPLGRVAQPFDEVLPAVLDGEAAGVVDLAILWMVSVPVATVLVVTVGFLRLGDRRYAALSLLALAVLGISIGLALGR